MSQTFQSGPVTAGPAPQTVSRDWFFLALMGVALMIVGLAAIGASEMATLATVLTFGVLLLVGALFQVLFGIQTRRWGGLFLHLLGGVLYFVAGVFMLKDPLLAAMTFTLLIAACLFVGGIVRIVLSLTEQFPHWGWVLLNGVVSVILGTAIWRQWPFSGLWVIGLFIGIEMLFSGLSWLMLGLALRRLGPTGRAV